jgi:hypothetical protein
MINNSLGGVFRSHRYLIRELIPRSIVAALVFALVMPRFPNGGVELSGGGIAAAFLGVLYTAYIVAAGQFVMFPFFARLQKLGVAGGLFALVSFLSLVILSGLFIEAATLTPLFTVHQWTATLVGAGELFLVCVLTHDYKASA